MWTRFLAVSDLGRVVSVIALIQGRGPFRWVPNFGEWVWDMTAARDLNRLHPVNTFTKITAEEAEHLVETLPRLDRRTFGWVLDELDREPERVSCADVGLASHVRVRRPSASKALFESVRKAPLGTWVKARVFPPDKGSAGRKWVSEVRQGRKHFESLGQLEAVLVPQADGSFEANIRRCVADVPLPELARSLASAAHGLQKDKAGLAYIDHPRRVAERLAGQGEAPEVVAAGWLHDVLEDTTVTAEDLASAGIPDHVVAAVEALTKRAGESLEAYTARVKASPIGVVVKRADIADNTDPARLAILDAATRNRLIAKYSRMGALL